MYSNLSLVLFLDQRRALVGINAFSGNDYIASFFRKGKKTNWKTVLKGFVELFIGLQKFCIGHRRILYLVFCRSAVSRCLILSVILRNKLF